MLADTSVWIRFLSGREPFASQLEGFLGTNEVVRHEMIFGELLIGDTGGGRSKLLEGFGLMRQADTVPHSEVIEFVRARGLSGRGVGWIDAHLLASAVVEGLWLWTADSALAALATEVGVALPIREPG